MLDSNIIQRLIRGFGKLGYLKTSLLRLLAWPAACLILGALLWHAVLAKIDAEKIELHQSSLNEASSLAHAYAQHVARAVEQMDQITLQIKFEWERSHGKLDLADLSESGVFRSSQTVLVLIADRKGLPVTYTRFDELPFRAVPLADRDYFRFHNSDKSNILLIGKPVIGSMTGQRIVQLTRRLETADGTFDGVVVVSVTPDYFTSFLAGSNPGKTGLLAVVGNDGSLRSARIGDAAPELSLSAFRTIPLFDSPQGATFLEGEQWFGDNRARFVGWETLKAYPLVAMAGIAEQELLAPHRKTWAIYRQEAVAASVVLLLLALAGMGWSGRLAWKKYYAEEVRNAYRIATEGGNEGFYMLRALRDKDGTIADFEVVDCNEHGASFYGVERAQLLGVKFSTRSSRPYFAVLTKAFHKAMESGFYESEIEIPPDGSFKMRWARVRLVRAGMGLAVTVQDISERKEFEAARARLAAIVENSNDAIISRTLDGIVLSWNAAAERLLGYSAADAIGKSINMIMPADQQHEPEMHSRVMLEGGLIPATEVVRRTKDGRSIHVMRSISPVRNDAGEVVGAAIVMSDNAERNRALAQVRLAASVFDNAAEGITITDKENNIVSVNRAFTEITGYPEQEVIGKNPSLLASGRQAPAFYDEMWASIKANGRWWGEVWDRRKNGELYCESLSICAVRDERGEITNYCAVFADITPRKIAETRLVEANTELEARVVQRTAELERANKDLEAFSYSVSHDLRAPLRSIGGFTSILLQHSTLDAESLDMLQRIGSAGERMGRIIDDLLSLARVSRQPLRRENLDLSALAGEVAAALGQAHPERDVDVAITPDMRIDADPGLARIVLENLIGNAWKFTARTDAARIEAGCEARAGETIYFVRDNGAGFDMKYADKLFGPFQRLHGDKEFEGTGIGLSIVQRIVARHGGRVWAEGEVGRGASFYFTVEKAGHSQPSPA